MLVVHTAKLSRLRYLSCTFTLSTSGTQVVHGMFMWYTECSKYVGYPSRNVRDRVDCNHLAHKQNVKVTFLWAVYLSHINFLPQQTLLWTL